MADENKNQTQNTVPKGGDQIKKLEVDLKTAFKESRITEVKKIAEELKKLDPENHLADRLLEKSQQTEADELRKANAGKIKELEDKMKMAFKSGNLAEVNQFAEAIKKLDPENKAANKIQSQIQEAKEALNANVMKEKVKVLSAELKSLLSDKKWDQIAVKANEILGLEWGNKIAVKALEALAKEEKIEAKMLITAEAPKELQKKIGFFGRLLGKKGVEVAKGPAEVAPSVIAKTEITANKNSVIPTASPVAQKTEVSVAPALAPKQEIKPVASVSPATNPKVEQKATDKTPATSMKVESKEEKKSGIFAKLFKKEANGEKIVDTNAKTQGLPSPDKKEEIKKSEEDLSLALKEGRNKDVQVLVEAIQKDDPENKAAKKAQEKLVKEKEKLEEESKKEKIKGMTAELKEFLKNEEWERVASKANEMLAVDKENKVAMKALKKMPEGYKKTSEPTVKAQNITPQAEEKKNIFAGFLKKEELEKPAEAKVAPMAMPAVAPATSAVAPVEVKKQIIPAVVPSAPSVVAPVVAKVEGPPAPVKSESPAPIKPITPAITPKIVTAPVAIVPVVAPVITPSVKPIAPMVAVPLGNVFGGGKVDVKKKEEAKGNMFTSLFGKKATNSENPKTSGSIIDTIVSQTDQAKKIKTAKKKEESTGEGFMHFASAFLRFVIAFIILSAGFFYVYNIDENNRVLSMAGRENFAVQLKNAATTIEEKQQQESKLSKEIEKYQKESENESIGTINKIRENRMDWPDLIKKLNEVTESVYEKNALAQYVQYNNYSYDVENGKLTVSATLSDPLGKNLTKLAEIEEAFIYYPKDKNDPNDETKPYFYGMESFNSYAKSFNKATGRYTSSFSLNISTKAEEGKKKK